MMRWIGRFVALLLALVLGVAEPAAARASGMAMTPCVSSHYVYDGTANNSPPTTEFAAVSAGSRASRVEHAVSATKDLSRLAAVFVAAEDGTMAGVRATDQEGETLAGIDQGAKVRIPSATGAAAYRIPDALTDTTLTEVKNVGSLSYTSQLQDFMSYASSTGRGFDLVVRANTTLSGALQQVVDSGQINLLRILPPK